MKKGDKKKAKKTEGTTGDLQELLDRVKFGLETSIDLMKRAAEPQPMNPQLVAVLNHAYQIVQEKFPDEIRAPIVAETGNDIGDLGAAVAWFAMRGDNNAAMVFAESIYALGYMAAKEETDPHFSNLDT